MQCALPWMPHRFSIGETHLHKAQGLPPKCPVPCVRSGLETSWPAYSRAQWWKMSPHNHIEKILQGVWGHQLRTLSSSLPQPYAEYLSYVCLPVSLQGYFWQSPLLPICSIDKGISFDCLVAVQEALRMSSVISWKMLIMLVTGLPE